MGIFFLFRKNGFLQTFLLLDDLSTFIFPYHKYLKPIFRNSYTLIENLFDKNTQVNILYFNWEISAMHFWFLDSERSYYYKPTYDIKFNKYSPWMLLLSFMINEAKDKKCKYFDFLRWNETYKLKLTNKIFYNANIKDDNWN